MRTRISKMPQIYRKYIQFVAVIWMSESHFSRYRSWIRGNSKCCIFGKFARSSVRPNSHQLRIIAREIRNGLMGSRKVANLYMRFTHPRFPEKLALIPPNMILKTNMATNRELLGILAPIPHRAGIQNDHGDFRIPRIPNILNFHQFWAFDISIQICQMAPRNPPR